MKHLHRIIILAVLAVSIPLYADELNDLKLEVQKLKERVTGLNNATPTLDMKTWGNGFSIGIPVGLMMEDLVVGLEFAYPLKENLLLRLNAHLLVDIHHTSTLTGSGLRNERAGRPIAFPSLTLLGRSPMVYNTRVYGGITAGVAHDFLKHDRFYPLVMGVGGVEFYVRKHQTFYVEFGGGAVITPRRIDYGRGVMITGGSRFYL